MSDMPFSCALSHDKSQIKLVAQAGTLDCSAEQVRELALYFANLRAQMTPLPPDEPDDVVRLEGDRWQAFKKLQDGSARVYSRIPGLGWSFIHLTHDACVKLASVVNPKPLG